MSSLPCPSPGMCRRLFGAGLFASTCLILATTPASAQDAASHTLRYDFDRLAGKTAIYTVETELQQSVQHADDEQTQGTRWRRDTFEQGYQRKGQSGRVLQERKRIEVRISEPSSPIPVEYDSDGGAEPPEVLGLKTEGLGRAVTIEMTRRGQVTRVRGVRSAIERAGYAASFLRFPKDPVAVGGEWTRPAVQRVPYPPFGTLLYHTRYRLEAVREDGGYLVRATIDVLFEPEPPAEDQPDPPKVHVDAQEAGGTLEFTAAGLLVESRFRSVLAIKIKSGATERVEKATSTTVQRLRETLSPKQRRERDARAERDKAKEDAKREKKAGEGAK